MHRDPDDPKLVWMTEKELRSFSMPAWGMWMMVLAGPLGIVAAQLLWHFVIRH